MKNICYSSHFQQKFIFSFSAEVYIKMKATAFEWGILTFEILYYLTVLSLLSIHIAFCV